MTWTGRVLSVLAVLPILMGAVMNLTRAPQAVEGSKQYGYSPNTMLPLGITAVVCVLLYLIPRTALLGAILLTGFLGGATATHVRASEAFVIPVVVGVIVWLGLLLREPRVRGLLPLASPPVRV
jgi:hypothetical protein